MTTTLYQAHRLYVSPNGMTATWLHALDLTTGHYPQYADWIDATDLDDAAFDELVIGLQRASVEV
ncbi:hypothetical protein [Burkholderia gladioli]|uniref:hypothetical protein n=1 Tax=Burkholderia gladioli TaxID=28095 RepID=UPI0015E62E5A|nr:hypothetical protein [Burkholderia gladioli]MBA1366242.1 hypothetical protein [Burkholderia gladioli]